MTATASRPRVLVLEDIPMWRELFTALLQAEGFLVDAAADPPAAAELMKSNLYHLLVLDTSMVSGDAENQEGVEYLRALQKDGQAQAMAVVVVSGYGDEERVRRYFEELHVDAFRSKRRFDRKEFVQLAAHLLKSSLRINLGLKVHWQEITPEKACKDLRLFGGRLKESHPLFQRVLLELEDLLCRLFHGAHEIVVQPMKRGHSGTGVLRVQPFFAMGAGLPVVLKFGDADQIEQERRNFEAYVKGYLGRATNIEATGRTPLLGGIVYSLLGIKQDEFESFGSFYLRSTADQIKPVFADLFDRTCGNWYSNPGQLRPMNLSRDYRDLLDLTPEPVEAALAGLKGVQGKERLRFSALSLDRTFPNPLPAARREIIKGTYECTNHGDLNAGNILVDASGATWLIDFLRTGRGHILRDFAQLDTTVRIQLLLPEEAALDERLEMEEALLSVRRLSDFASLPGRFRTSNAALQKCYETVAEIRRLAADQVKHNVKDDPAEYYTGLFFFALSQIRYWDLPSLQREHACLAASLLADRITH